MFYNLTNSIIKKSLTTYKTFYNYSNISSLQNILKGLKINNTIFLDFKIPQKSLIDKFILPQLAPPPINKNLTTAYT